MVATQPPKVCIYCGAQNPAARMIAWVCHSALISEEEVAQAIDEFIPGAPSATPSAVSLAQETGGLREKPLSNTTGNARNSSRTGWRVVQ